MSRRTTSIRRTPIFLAAALFALCSIGCVEDEFDPQTWIDKLEDPSETQNAITRLERLKDPVAIAPLAKVWQERGKPRRVLNVIIELAANGKDGEGPPQWDDALPVLRMAIDEFDVGDNRSIENAKLAADALGKAKDKESLESLVKVVKKPMPRLSTGQEVRRSAVSALGQFSGEPRAVEALIGVLRTDLKDQPVQLFAAAALALSDSRSPKAVLPLLEALYQIPPIYPQCRRALIAIGAPVIPELIKIFEGDHKEMNAIAKKNEFNIDCSKEMGPDSSCKAPTNLEFKAATLLGDLYAKEAVDPLLAGLKRKSQPAFFLPNGAPGPSQHTAILDALRKINDHKASKPILEYWKDDSTDDVIRPIAIDVYSTLATDTEALEDLAKLIKDDDQEGQIRMAAGQAYGRLARSPSEFEPLLYMVNRYRKEAEKNDREAKKQSERLEKAKEAKKPQGQLDKLQQEVSIAEGRAASYRNFQRAFEQHLARAQTGVTCKADPACYAGMLEKSGDDIGKLMEDRLTDLDKWSEGEKKSLQLAASDRAFFELVKMGDKASGTLDALLKVVESSERIIRQGTLLAMVHVAPLPCDKCVTRLEEVIAMQKDQTTLAQLTMDTQAVRNYFLWAGK
ncbi:MAG: hypothetical protein Tsb0020_20780 [Haliangiales bacterium]